MNRVEKLRNIGIHNVEELRGFHNAIYKGTYGQSKVVIRVSNRRELSDIAEEIRILNQLKDQVRLARPIAINEHYVMEIEGEVYCFFEKVEGKNWYETTLTEETHFQAGKELGKLHLALQKIPQVNRAPYYKHPDLALLDGKNPLYKQAKEDLFNELAKKEKTKDTYGVIHGDYLFSNLLYHQGEVTIIDFDDMEYNFYLYDIAVYHFYLLLGGNPAQMDIEPNERVFQSFMKGYRSVNKKTKLDFQDMQDMFRLRQLALLATITTKFDQSKLGDWQKNYIALSNEQLNENKNFIDIDYHKLYQELNQS